jgi:hypothetical protein
MNEDSLSEMTREREKEVAMRLKWAKETASAFSGLSIEAVLLGIREHAFIVWGELLRSARLAQLDIDQANVRRKHDEVHKHLMAALEESRIPGEVVTRANISRSNIAWKRYQVLHKESLDLELEQDRIWKRRSELLGEKRA